MTETRPQQGIDPRFDPRFQRGYEGDADASVAPPLDAEPEADAAAPVVERSTPGGSPAPAAAWTPAPAASVSPDRARTPAPAPAPAESASPADPEDDVLFPPEFAEADDGPSPAEPWFLAAWGVAVIAIVVGGAFWWAGLMADNPFSGVNQSDRWLQYVGWVVAPSLIQGGLLGLVAMFVWTGIRWARRHSGSS
ncbi:hypothetical protein [Agromyces mariniharenae]|uniref:Uncharacterized protein n=1 Tax=Agromyces mariniharenae TaxID=2604423 RepID=A0A5S4V9P4_9MICO|nr:hypothetical protein [Agromyces mariniharenae]TYL53320.1 hypothetical protein FYC51_06450 [Agromyces mariniharenae]